MRAPIVTLALACFVVSSCGRPSKKKSEGSPSGVETPRSGPDGTKIGDAEAKRKQSEERKAREEAETQKREAAEQAAKDSAAQKSSSSSDDVSNHLEQKTISTAGLKPVKTTPATFLGHWVTACVPETDGPFASGREEVEFLDGSYIKKSVSFYDAACLKRGKVDAVRISMKELGAAASGDRIVFTPVLGPITRTYLGKNAALDAKVTKRCGVADWEAGAERVSAQPALCWRYRLISSGGVFEARVVGGELTVADVKHSKGTAPDEAPFDDAEFVPNPILTGYFPSACIKLTVSGSKEFPGRSINSYHFFEALDGDKTSKGTTYFYDSACTRPLVSERVVGSLTPSAYLEHLRSWKFDVQWGLVKERMVYGARAAEEATARAICGGLTWKPGEWADITKHVDATSFTCDGESPVSTSRYVDFPKEGPTVFGNAMTSYPVVHDDSGVAAPKPIYEGAWVTDCLPGSSGSTRILWDFSAGRADLYAYSFGGSTCDSVNFYTVTLASGVSFSTLDYEGQFRFQGAAKARLLAPGSVQWANTLNTINRCARSDWAVGVFVDMTAIAGCDNSPLESFDFTSRVRGTGEAATLDFESLVLKRTSWPFANLPKAP